MMPNAPAVLLNPPTHFDDRHSVWLQRFQTGPGAETGKIETKEIAAEYDRVYQSVARLFTPYDSQPSNRAAELATKLKAVVKTFMLGLDYWGEQDKPYSNLCLSVRTILMAKPYIQITEAQATRIIDYLATEGFLDKANDSKERPPGQGRHYRLWVRVGDIHQYVQYEEWLGWDMKMLQRLDGLRTVLEGDAAKDMDRLLGPLSGHREEWKKQATTQPDTTSTQRQGE